MPRIFDNIEQHLTGALQESLRVAYKADFCVGYFNLRGWKHIDCHIDQWQGGEGNQCRLLVGMHQTPREGLEKFFSLRSSQTSIDRAQVVRLKKEFADHFRKQLTFGTPTARDEKGLQRLVKQLKSKKLEVKLFARHALHAKLYLTYRQDSSNPRTGFVGSSNLTFSGLSGNGELNVDVLDHDASAKLADWFEDRWTDPFCVDISEELITVIEESWAREDLLDPYLIYIKMAYHLSLEAREGLRTFDIPYDFRNLLFPYQSAAVKIAAHHLSKRGGVIIGDVVGLGKTMMASALARIFEDNEGTSTLIICPKNLERMWQSYVDTYGMRARVLPISKVLTDLQDIPARFRLVLLDESHNLRNRESKRYLAIQEYIRESASKVILLSATPYNKTYLDLSNQLRLFVEEQKDLGIRPERYIKEIGGEIPFNVKHNVPIRSIGAFEHSEYPDDWRELMRLYLIRRTRSFIKENYALHDHTNNKKYLSFGDGTRAYFPERLPRTITFELDEANPKDQYAKLYAEPVVDIINTLTLPRYGLGNYIHERPKHPANPDEAKQLSNLSRAGQRLMGFSRINLFKRLESSGHAFLQSLERHILRNYVYAYAFENNLDIPIGTQSAEMLDTTYFDEDSDAVANAQNLFEDDQNDDTNEVLPEPEDLWTEEQFMERAQEVYTNYSTLYKRRFKWIRANLFKKQLLNHLKDDSRKLTWVLHQSGEWNPKEDIQLNALINLITQKHPKEKILIFSQFADTVRYLENQLKARGIKQSAAATGQSSDPTQLAWRFSPESNNKQNSISNEDELRVLIATDVLSEGQNLQDSHIVINYDLPWAIIRLIQRAGRIDRIGQKAEQILVYTFLPADGIERIIKLRARVLQRLKENAEVVGTDEAFFEDEIDQQTLLGLYNENAGLLEDDPDSDVDLASQAYQIWQNAIDENPNLAKLITNMPNVLYGTKHHNPTPSQPEGALVYMQTSEGNDALAWVDKNGQSVTESQYAILKAAECLPNTQALQRLENHHELVEKGVNLIIKENRSVGGQLGRTSGARYRSYIRLKNFYESQKGTLFENKEIENVLDDLYRYPLYQSATDNLNRKLRSGMTDSELAELTIALREDDRLCIIHEGDTEQEPTIICSMGLSHRGE